MLSLNIPVKSLSAALVLASATSHAAVVLNSGFEDVTVLDGANVGGSFVGWTAGSGSAGFQNLPASPVYLSPDPSSSNQNAYVNDTSSLSQLTSETITAGNTYTLTVDVGQLNVFAGSTATIRMYGSTLGIGTAIAEDAAFAPAPGSYTTRTFAYVAPVGGAFDTQTVGIALLGLGGIQVIFDNVRFDVAQVPEASSLLLGGLGALALLRRRRI